MGKEFLIRDLGSLNLFLGIQVNKTPEGLHMNQSQYLATLLKGNAMDNLKLVITPITSNLN